MKKLILLFTILTCFATYASAQSKSKDPCQFLCNSDFEQPVVPAGAGNFIAKCKVKCWNTTEAEVTDDANCPKGNIEFWNGSVGPGPHSGNQFIELNAKAQSKLYQDFIVTPGMTATIKYWAAGRAGYSNNMQVSIATSITDPSPVIIGSSVGVVNVWTMYTFTHTFTGTGTNYTIIFESLDAGQGGNFLDDITVSCPDVTNPEPCCNIPGLDVSLTETSGALNLTINAGSTAIQEVNVTMMDYHAEYSNPLCKRANIGMLGVLSSTTSSLGTLNFDNTSNNTHSLVWKLGAPSVLNNQQVNLSVTQPLVLQLPCCDVKFYYCLKVRVKDINCNVCEKILCSGPEGSNCGCKGKWNSNSSISYNDINGKKHDTKIDCFAKIYNGPVPVGSNITYNASAYTCDKPGCIATYPWKIIDVNTNSIVNSGTATSLPISFTVPSGSDKYEFIVYASCGGKRCDSCGFYFRTKGGSECKCNDEASFAVNYGDGTTGNIKCGKSILAAYQSILTFTPASLCIPKECPTNYTYEIRDLQTDALVWSQSMIGSNPFTVTMNSLTGYKIKIVYNCSGIKCECEFYIRIKDGGQACNCGNKWKSDNILMSYTSVQPCPPSRVLKCDREYSIKPVTNATFTFPNYTCTPASCNATYDWKITSNTTLPTQTGTTNTISNANLSLPGTYIITMTPTCGGTKCNPCKITINVGQGSAQCDPTLNTEYNNAATFASTFTSSQLIDFATNENGTSITDGQFEKRLLCWKWNGVTFNEIWARGQWGENWIYNNPVIANFPIGLYTKVGFEFSTFSGNAGTFTFKVYSGGNTQPCTYTRTGDGNVSYFGIMVPGGIDKIEISLSPTTDRVHIDNFRFGN